MQPRSVRLLAAGAPPASGAHTLAVVRPRDGRPVGVELFNTPRAHPGAFCVDPNPVVPGDGPAVFVAVLHRRPGLGHDEFSRYWRDGHARFGRLIPHARSYVQLHTAADAPVDGVVLVGFDSVELLRSGLHDPIVAVDARADEERFVDHSRSYGLVCTRLRTRAPR